MTDLDEDSRAERAMMTVASRGERAMAEARRRASLRGIPMAEHEENVQKDDENLIDQLAEQEAAYEAWAHGLSHPDDVFYARIWRGDAPGVDADKALDRLDRDRKMLAKLESGEVTFQEIPGWRALGDTRDLVIIQLNRRCEMYEEALRSGGRNLSVNQAHVAKMRNRGDRA